MRAKKRNQSLPPLKQKGLMQGFTLLELLVTVLMSSVILVAAAAGIMPVLRSSNKLESQTTRSSGLNRAIAYMQEEIKAASTVQREVPGATPRLCGDSTVSPIANRDLHGECLLLIYPDGNNDTCPDRIIYYAFRDISSGQQTWLKPGILIRKEAVPIAPPVCTTADATTTQWEGTSGGTPSWQVLADGLLGFNEHNPNPTCETGWSGPFGNSLDIPNSGDIRGGFRFCLGSTAADNRRAQIFLYGYILSDNIDDTIQVNVITFARAE